MFVKPGHRQDDPALPLIVRGPNRRLLSPQGENAPEITFCTHASAMAMWCWPTRRPRRRRRLDRL